MRVLVLTNLYPNPHEAGRATFNRQQLAALARQHQVRVIAPIAWTRRACRNVPRRREQDGMVVEHPAYWFTPEVLRGRYGRFYARSVRSLFAAAVREFRPDVVLGSWAYPDGWAAVKLAREAGLPVAIKVHGSDLLTLRRGSARRQRAAEALRAADAVIAVGHGLQEVAISLGVPPARTHLVPNGIDVELFRPGSRDAARRKLGVAVQGRLVLFVGNLVRVKGPDILVHALARLRSIDCQCVLIGEGPWQARLQAGIKSLGMTDRITLAGSRPHSEIADWYRAADLVVLPSRSEGVPNVLLEAMACGTPVVASGVGDVPRLVDPAGLVPAGDVPALADRIRLFIDPAARPTTSVRQPAGSWEQSARQLASVLSSITERTQRVAA